MASLLRPWKTVWKLNGKRVPAGTPGATKEKTRSRVWYGQYKDSQGVWRRKPLSANKSAAQQILNEIVKQVDLERAGLVELASPVRDKPWEKLLQEHLRENPNNTAEHRRDIERSIRRVLGESGAITVGQIDRNAVASALANLKEIGKAARTVNKIRGFLIAFGKFLLKRGHSRNPFSDLPRYRESTDKRRNRGVLTLEEQRRLLEVCCRSKSPHLRKRGLTYRLALFAGLRSREIATLTRESFPPDCSTVTIAPQREKARRGATLPLPPDLAADLRQYLDSLPPGAALFPGRLRNAATRNLASDLKRAGIDQVDSQGRIRDFHALRHTFITTLVQAGVNVKEVQLLARHASPETTLRYYAHTTPERLRTVVESLFGCTRETQKPSTGLDQSGPIWIFPGDGSVELNYLQEDGLG